MAACEDLGVWRQGAGGYVVLGGDGGAQVADEASVRVARCAVGACGVGWQEIGAETDGAVDAYPAAEASQQRAVQREQRGVRSEQRALQLVFVVEKEGCGTVGRLYGAPVSYWPSLGVVQLDFVGASAVAEGAVQRDAEGEASLRCAYQGAVAERLLGERFILLNDHLGGLCHAGHVGHRGQIGRGEEQVGEGRRGCCGGAHWPKVMVQSLPASK